MKEGGVSYGKAAQPNGQIILSDVRCNGTEMGLHQCEHSPFRQHSCFYRESVDLTCAETVEGIKSIVQSKHAVCAFIKHSRYFH